MLMQRWWRKWVGTAALALLMPENLASQAQTRATDIDGRPSCVNCTIELRRVATLRPPPSADPIGVVQHVARNSRGDLFVSSSARSSVLVFDGSGRFMRQFGSKGDGPGELRDVIGLHVGAGDSLYVFQLNRRVTVFSSDFAAVRTFTLPGNYVNAVLLSGGAMVVEGSFRSPGSVGYPAHVIGRDGSLRRSLGIEGQFRSDIRCHRCNARYLSMRASWHSGCGP
jgi:6-bladed beta-propeller protein